MMSGALGEKLRVALAENGYGLDRASVIPPYAPQTEAPRHRHSVWAMLMLSEHSERELRDFFEYRLKARRKKIAKRMHLTVYHARRRLPGLLEIDEACHVEVPSSELRLMVMAPGGENPRPDLDPGALHIGLRVRRASGATRPIEEVRSRFYQFETAEVLGSRQPSNRMQNAFGARHFQPHVTVLRPGSGIEDDLTNPGKLLRSHIERIKFDRLVVSLRDGEARPVSDASR